MRRTSNRVPRESLSCTVFVSPAASEYGPKLPRANGVFCTVTDGPGPRSIGGKRIENAPSGAVVAEAPPKFMRTVAAATGF